MQIFNLLKKAQADNPSLSGPEIDMLIDVVHKMIERGAPNEYDDVGFNKIDFPSAIINYFRGIGKGATVPANMVTSIMRRLSIYQRQINEISNYDVLKSGIISLMSNSTKTINDDKLNYNSDTVQLVGRGKFKKKNFLIPGFSSGKRVLNKIIEEKAQELYRAGHNDFKPHNGRSGFKAFCPADNGIDVYGIRPEVMSIVADFLETKKYDVSVLREEEASISTDGSRSQSHIKEIKSVNFEVDDYGRNRVSIDLDGFLREFVNYIKDNLPRSSWEYDPDTYVWTIINPSISFIDGLSSMLNGHNYGTSKLDEVKRKLESIGVKVEDSHSVTDEGKEDLLVRVKDVSANTGGKWLMFVSYFPSGVLDADMRLQFNDTLKYNFVGWTTNEDEKDQDILRCKAKFGVYIRGTQNDFIDFARILHARGFDVSKVLEVAQKILDNGFLSEERQRGEVDGFESNEEFDSAARKYESGFGNKLYSEQVDGIKFLYGNQSALLGDQTGTGKTLQLVSAADLRLEKSGGKCVIVTVNSVVGQMIKDVKKITGISDDEISLDPYAETKYRVLSYSLFSAPTKRKEVTRHLMSEAKSGNISVMVLDEVHNVKNGNPKNRRSNDLNHKGNHTTFNIQEISQYVPFVWGVSGTIVANKPIDLYNQLVAINHKLGKIKYKTFQWSFDSPNYTPDEKMISADKLKEILLDQRVYIQRTKNSIREDMPEQIISSENIKVDMSRLSQVIQDKMDGYSNPNLAISAMIAFRTVIASFKVPKSLSIARDAISQGKKVGIFTCYDGSAELLIEGLNRIVKEYSPGGTVARIHGGQSNRQDVIDNFKREESSDVAIVINIKAGGTGLDFPNIVTDVIVNDFDWSPSNDSQSLGRFFRINSEEDINVSYVIANETEDRNMYQRLEQKRIISERIENLSDKEMQLLNEGRRGDDKKIRALRAEKRKAVAELADIEKNDKNYIKSTGNSIIGMLDGNVVASRKSWYGLLKV